MNLLRKVFIKNYQDVNNKKVRDAHGILAAFVGVFSNLILFAIKMLAGIISGSISIMADSINNLSDMGSSIITLIGFKLSAMPPDREHPFGHERMEYIASLIVSIIILFVGFELGYNSILKIINNEKSTINILVLVILGISILIKIWQSLFNKKIGKLIHSVALEATAMDSRNDVIATSIIFVGSIITFFIPNLSFSLDGVLGVLVSIFILISGIGLVKDSINPLLGDAADPGFVNKIINDIKQYPYVLGVHDPICHMYGPTKCFMTCHVEVPSDENINKIHDIIDNIEREVGGKYGCLLTIHMDPIDNKSPNVIRLKEKLAMELRTLDERLTLHDFRIVEGPSHTNLIFDVLLPADLKKSKDDILRGLYEALANEEKTYYLIVNFDHNFVME